MYLNFKKEQMFKIKIFGKYFNHRFLRYLMLRHCLTLILVM